MAELSSRHAREVHLVIEAHRKGHSVRVDELRRTLAVSPATIYNDVETLERLRFVNSRGVLQARLDDADSRFPERFGIRSEIKTGIAREIVERLLPTGAVVYLDTGSTCFYVAREILRASRSDVSLITANPYILELALHQDASNEMLFLGGALRRVGASLHGPLTEAAIREVSYDIAIISVDFVHADRAGTLATFSDAEVSQKRVAARQAKRSVIIATDTSKLGRNLGNAVDTLQELATTRAVAVIVGTDAALSAEQTKSIDLMRTSVGPDGDVHVLHLNDE